KELAQAIFIVNRHAKTALEPQHLYTIKKTAIEKLLKENMAKKIGLHFSNNPKYSNHHSTLLIKVDQYFFHLSPSKEDFQQLTHLGHLNENNLKKKKNHKKKEHFSSYYTPSSLGKMEWPPTKKFH